MSRHTFTLKAEHLKLLGAAFWGFNDCEYGAPEIDPKRPYGNSGRLSIAHDMREHLGIPALPDEERTDEQIEKDDGPLHALHRELTTALEVIFTARTLEPGDFECEGERWDRKVWRRVAPAPLDPGPGTEPTRTYCDRHLSMCERQYDAGGCVGCRSERGGLGTDADARAVIAAHDAALEASFVGVLGSTLADAVHDHGYSDETRKVARTGLALRALLSASRGTAAGVVEAVERMLADRGPDALTDLRAALAAHRASPESLGAGAGAKHPDDWCMHRAERDRLRAEVAALKAERDAAKKAAERWEGEAVVAKHQQERYERENAALAESIAALRRPAEARGAAPIVDLSPSLVFRDEWKDAPEAQGASEAGDYTVCNYGHTDAEHARPDGRRVCNGPRKVAPPVPPAQATGDVGNGICPPGECLDCATGSHGDDATGDAAKWEALRDAVDEAALGLTANGMHGRAVALEAAVGALAALPVSAPAPAVVAAVRGAEVEVGTLAIGAMFAWAESRYVVTEPAAECGWDGLGRCDWCGGEHGRVGGPATPKTVLASIVGEAKEDATEGWEHFNASVKVRPLTLAVSDAPEGSGPACACIGDLECKACERVREATAPATDAPEWSGKAIEAACNETHVIDLVKVITGETEDALRAEADRIGVGHAANRGVREVERLRAALARVERERDEARKHCPATCPLKSAMDAVSSAVLSAGGDPDAESLAGEVCKIAADRDAHKAAKEAAERNLEDTRKSLTMYTSVAASEKAAREKAEAERDALKKRADAACEGCLRQSDDTAMSDMLKIAKLAAKLREIAAHADREKARADAAEARAKAESCGRCFDYMNRVNGLAKRALMAEADLAAANKRADDAVAALGEARAALAAREGETCDDCGARMTPYESSIGIRTECRACKRLDAVESRVAALEERDRTEGAK